MRIALVTNKKICSHKYNMTLWTNPTGENSIQAKWEIGKTAPANMISLWEQIQMWKWPPAEIRNGRRTCLVIQLGNCGIFRTLFCRICILRHGWGQFTITCHRCSAIFLQDQPLFSNFPLFEVLETQLTFKSVGEPDYAPPSYFHLFQLLLDNRGHSFKTSTEQTRFLTYSAPDLICVFCGLSWLHFEVYICVTVTRYTWTLGTCCLD